MNSCRYLGYEVNIFKGKKIQKATQNAAGVYVPAAPVGNGRACPEPCTMTGDLRSPGPAACSEPAAVPVWGCPGYSWGQGHLGLSSVLAGSLMGFLHL